MIPLDKAAYLYLTSNYYRGAVISLGRPLTITRAALEGNRRNTQKSTGPRTARGKAWSRPNGLSTGEYSLVLPSLFSAQTFAQSGRVEGAVRAIMASELIAQPLFAAALEGTHRQDRELIAQLRRTCGRREKRVAKFLLKRSLNVTDNKGRGIVGFWRAKDVIENKAS